MRVEGRLFTYTVTTSTETSGETSVTVYTYTVQYVGNEKFKEIFGLDEKKTELAYSYAENLTTFLYGSNLVSGTAAVSADVERYSDKITKYAEQYGIPGFVAVIKCVMMAESGGRGTDVMQCSECPYNTKYSNAPNSITDVDYSIEIGIKYLAECLKQAECTSPTDMPRLSLALQGYNYGNGYIDWAKKKYNGYSQANAQEFSNMMKANSNRKLYRYDWVWDKRLTTGFLNAKRMPLRRHEMIAVFYKKLPKYRPQFTEGMPLHSKGVNFMKKEPVNNNYGQFTHNSDERKGETKKYPTSIIQIDKSHPSISKHATEKPIKLLEYLIKTYTDEGDIVYDGCSGSGSTCIAAIDAGRKFIGHEIDRETYEKSRCEIEKSNLNVAFLN